MPPAIHNFYLRLLGWLLLTVFLFDDQHKYAAVVVDTPDAPDAPHALDVCDTRDADAGSSAIMKPWWKSPNNKRPGPKCHGFITS